MSTEPFSGLHPFSIPGFADHLGIRIVDWPDEGPHLALDIRPEFLNRNGAVHGGVILSLLDMACSLSGCRWGNGAIQGRVVAVSLTTNFVAPALAGTLHARGRRRGGGSRLLIAEGEVADADGRLIATASGVVRRIGETNS